MVDRSRKSLVLPWASEPGDRLRFFTVFAVLLAIFLPLAVLIPTINLPELQQPPQPEEPSQYARLLPPPEPTPEPVVEQKPEPVAEIEPVVEIESKPEPEPVVKAEPEPNPVVAESEPAAEEPEPAETVEQAREIASQSGLAAMRDELAEMRSLASSSAPPQVTQPVSAEATVSAASGAERRKGNFASQPSSDLKDSADPSESVRLAARQTQDLKPDTGQDQDADQAASREAAAAVRPMAEIRATFDRNKTALFSLYNRALRQNPTLAGTLLLELVIEPGGEVSAVRVISSELEDQKLEQRLMARVQMFDFGKAKVEQRTVEYPVNFLPPG